MISLTVYSYLTNKDIIKGKKIVGEIVDVKYKLIGAVNKKADLFLVLRGANYDETIKVKKEKNMILK
ncbi:MAG: hypothetical protein J6D28_01610 [Bacilli bacterium]|nr:hypothetical protein [Bacilli bacterium]